ncbi:MAG: glycosyl hydrolase family 9 [Bacteroides sp.]|nr:glycosyl hydrolase family 9 [Bacteroides sp.]
MSTSRFLSLCFAAIYFSSPLCQAVGQTTDAKFESALVHSGYIHEPLSHTDGISLEAEAEMKQVADSRKLHGEWRCAGKLINLSDSDTATVMHVNFNTGTSRAKGSPADPDYALYGHAVATLRLGGISLERYNRLCLTIEPRCPGIRVVNINLSFNNKTHSGKGFNPPTGAHLIQLKNNTLNRCYLEIADLRRDCVDDISLSVSVNGRDLPTASEAIFLIHDISAQTIANPEKVSGWNPSDGRIIYSQSGYSANGEKTAICGARLSDHTFKLVSSPDNRTVYESTITRRDESTGTYGVIDFSPVSLPGNYRIIADSLSTDVFSIGEAGLWDRSCWKVLNFIFCQRCGYPVPGIHSRCHTDLFSEHAGMKRPYSGGWHDAGDLSQQTLQTADVCFSLLKLYESRRYSNPALASRLREEALWGLDFVLRSRLSDGYHASSMGLLIWQDGIVGSHDDISSVRVQNLPFDNYLYAAYEAYAARVLDDGTDPMLVDYLRKAAIEDYDFAKAGFEEHGFGGWISPYEHTYCTGESQFMATASWAASLLYLLSGESRYAEDARNYADYVLASQSHESIGDAAITGFFYRNPDHRSVVHFIHQSREQVFMHAMATLCLTQPSHPDCTLWRKSIEDYGKYIKSLMSYTAPYGMIPAGIYRSDEYLDTEAFFSVHLFPPDDAPRQFTAQAEKGIQVAPGFVVRRFPIWFNIFNGNLAVHMSMGEAAAICGNILGDRRLMDIAREQLYWVVGKNPFAQSLIYGEGSRYPSLNNFSSGEIIGAMPVGIRSLGDSDEPYWPQINNACYKEVWLTSAGKWLALVAATEQASEPVELISYNSDN